MRNIEKLRDYFLGKDPQLKETLSDNSLRLIGIEGKHFVLRTELLKRLTELRKYVDDKDEEIKEELEGLIDDLETSLGTETLAREAADTTLQNNINAEKLARQAADGTLQNYLDAEAIQREEADRTIQGYLDAEAIQREEADGTLQGNINTLSGRVGTAETNITNLQGAVAGKQDTLTAGENITIENNVISATGGATYTAGDNITIENDVISAVDTTYTAGTNVSITNNVISATDTTYPIFTGATSSANGKSGLVPPPFRNDRGKFLRGDCSWMSIPEEIKTLSSTFSLVLDQGQSNYIQDGVYKVADNVAVRWGNVSGQTFTTSGTSLLIVTTRDESYDDGYEEQYFTTRYWYLLGKENKIQCGRAIIPPDVIVGTVPPSEYYEDYKLSKAAIAITSSSTDDELPTAKAVYDFVNTYNRFDSITLFSQSNFSTTPAGNWTKTLVALPSAYRTVGTGLSYEQSTHSVKIGAGIIGVAISFQVKLGSSVNSSFQVEKTSGNTHTICYPSLCSNNNTVNTNALTTYVDVKEGDIIQVYMYVNTTSNITFDCWGTGLTVTAIAYGEPT